MFSDNKLENGNQFVQYFPLLGKVYRYKRCILELIKAKQTNKQTKIKPRGRQLRYFDRLCDCADYKVKVPVYWPPIKGHCGICANGL